MFQMADFWDRFTGQFELLTLPHEISGGKSARFPIPFMHMCTSGSGAARLINTMLPNLQDETLTG
jgi:hypothetical protein